MQAVVVTAYKDREQIKNLIRFYRDKMLVLIHIDRKSTINPEDIMLEGFENLKVIKKYSISHGSLCHLYAIFDLLEMAVSDERVTYIHTISAQDMAVKPLDYFYNGLDTSKIYMDYIEQKDFNTVTKQRYELGCVNSETYRPTPMNIRMNTLYYYLRGKKPVPIGDFSYYYKGLIWRSMPKEAFKHIVDYVHSHPALMKNLKHIKAPEEFFLQTIIMNSPYRDLVQPNNRYMVWERRNGSNPAVLDETDYEKIVSGDWLFARKMDSEISAGLIKKLEEHREGSRF